MNASDKVNHPPFNSEDDYTCTRIGFFCFVGVRYLQMIIGIIGNGLTLQIIRNRKVLTKGHILMTYLAISDLFMSCIVPLATYTAVSRSFENSWRYWKTLCIVKEYMYKSASAFSILCYCALSVDR